MFKINDVVRIKNLLEPEDEWNGQLAIVISDVYIHQLAGKKVVKIKIRDTLWAIETNNVENVSEEEKINFFRTLEGNQICKWSDCFWKPTIIGKDFTI